MTTGQFSPLQFVLGCAVIGASLATARHSLFRLRVHPDAQFDPGFIALTATIIVAILVGIGLLAASFLDFGS